jgi:hypothetical protein
VALANKPCYILTYNIKDYKKEELEKEEVFVVTPVEMLKIIGIRKLDIDSLMKRKSNIVYYLLKWFEMHNL